MRVRHLLLALAWIAQPLVAQHVHPHPPSSHGHDQVRVRHMDFGTVDLPPNVPGTVRLGGGSPLSLTVSPLLKVTDTASAGPATYYIHDAGVIEGDETTWKVLPPPASALSFDLINTTDGTSTIRLNLDPTPTPGSGRYIRARRSFQSELFGWGGTLTIPPDAPSGTYTAVTPTWTTLGPISGQPVNGFVITEDFCSQGVTYGISSESSTFRITFNLQRTRNALQVTPVADLHFGSIIPGSTSGTVTLAPRATVSRTPSGVTLADSGTPASPGIFTILGAPNSTVDFLMPTSATLTEPSGGTMPVTDFTYAIQNALSATVGNGATGAFKIQNFATDAQRLVTFLVGAKLTVAPGQRPGSYTGTYPLYFAYR